MWDKPQAWRLEALNDIVPGSASDLVNSRHRWRKRAQSLASSI